MATSPPPITTTVSGSSGRAPALIRRRNSTPSMTRASSSPGTFMALPHQAPIVSSTASWRSLSSSSVTSRPSAVFRCTSSPGQRFCSRSMSSSMIPGGRRNAGMPQTIMPPIFSVIS